MLYLNELPYPDWAESTIFQRAAFHSIAERHAISQVYLDGNGSLYVDYTPVGSNTLYTKLITRDGDLRFIAINGTGKPQAAHVLYEAEMPVV